jgi:hypothetical protein
LNNELGYATGSMFIVAALSLVLSYLWMQKVFIETSTLKKSQYKSNLQKGFLIVAVAYGLRAVYSISFKYFTNLASRSYFWNMFF